MDLASQVLGMEKRLGYSQPTWGEGSARSFSPLFRDNSGGMAGPTNPTCGPILLAEKEVTGRTLRAHAGSMAGPPSVFDQGASLRLGLTSRRGVTLPLGAKGSSRSFFSALS